MCSLYYLVCIITFKTVVVALLYIPLIPLYHFKSCQAPTAIWNW